MNPIQVIAAVIIKENQILAVQRGTHKYPYLANKWEFPGGKMEAGETEESEPTLTEHLAFIYRLWRFYTIQETLNKKIICLLLY